MTPANGSKKAHIAPPPRSMQGHPDTDQAPSRETGQYSGSGTPPIEKK
jgi:hypothetical protein